MKKYLAPLGVLPYQDNIVIASESIKEHIEKVQKVLEVITYTMGLRLQLNKC